MVSGAFFGIVQELQLHGVGAAGTGDTDSFGAGIDITVFLVVVAQQVLRGGSRPGQQQGGQCGEQKLFHHIDLYAFSVWKASLTASVSAAVSFPPKPLPDQT